MMNLKRWDKIAGTTSISIGRRRGLEGGETITY